MMRVEKRITRFGLALSALTLFACFGGDDPSDDKDLVQVSYRGVYAAATGSDVHIHERNTAQTDANRFSVTQSKDLVGDTKFDLNSAPFSITYVVTRPGITLATTSIELTRDDYISVSVGSKRIRVEYNGTTVTATLEDIPL